MAKRLTDGLGQAERQQNTTKKQLVPKSFSLTLFSTEILLNARLAEQLVEQPAKRLAVRVASGLAWPPGKNREAICERGVINQISCTEIALNVTAAG